MRLPLLAVLLWAAGLSQQRVLAAGKATVPATVVRAHEQNSAQPAQLTSGSELNREAVAPPEPGPLPLGGPGPALVPLLPGFAPTWVVAALVLAPRPTALPNYFRVRLLLTALSPNAP
ncbi:hypothetical protein [Hymenobacter sp. BT491]|uniref:hypothetical protein n=1 Tax=Hymenobacter sp. BT491 TaxID=2766779 RepID=UPI0016538E90|nr:hypothetical protein [Hymenobacter sp. BT491]MBC6991083.1 hypothetical protein [Hymenobacter sp. BT491]